MEPSTCSGLDSAYTVEVKDARKKHHFGWISYVPSAFCRPHLI